MQKATPDDMNDEQSPVNWDRCKGCFRAGVELELFLVRAADRTVMGDWTAGWLKEIIKDPRRYL
jgi:hypothetical protein